MSTLEQRLLKSAELRQQFPNNSCCGRCQTPWPACTNHSTKWDEHNACFPLCEECWQELGTPEARLPFYTKLIAWWRTMGPIEQRMVEAIVAAVKAGG